ncbi:MAG TPA: hypothetical protein VM580_27205 [Labilithrix sp.]|nr:hypothetical protein [Labilithrix sp.]
MNSSAKISAFSFLAATALGALLFAGCTVTSGTVDDTDGGTSNNNNNKQDGGSSDDGGSDGGDIDAGPTCDNPNQQGYFISESCQACLEAKCCSQLTTCYGLPGDEANGKLDCNQYDECISDCGGKSGDELQACYADCDSLAADGVQTAYEAIESCGETSCVSECGLDE